jgi:hypothetical protein
MAKRRTSGIQRRSRASEEALSRRVGSGGAGGIDMRILILLGILVIGAVILVVVLLFGGDAGTPLGQRQRDDGGEHTDSGCQIGNYSSNPPTSGCHDPTPLNWGVYTSAAPANVTQTIHNLEHGGVVIWFQPGQLDEAGISALTDYVRGENQTNRYKVILSPWIGQDFGHAVAVTSWNWLLYLDSADVEQIRDFTADHYGDAPEPNGGPGPPG